MTDIPFFLFFALRNFTLTWAFFAEALGLVARSESATSFVV